MRVGNGEREIESRGWGRERESRRWETEWEGERGNGRVCKREKLGDGRGERVV